MWFFIFQSVALLSLACGFGVFAGWLFWGGANESTAPATGASVVPASASKPTLTENAEQLEARTADVVRLRQKLKRAVVELDRRAELLVAAREEHETLQLHLDALASQLAISGGDGAASGADGASTSLLLAPTHTDLAEPVDLAPPVDAGVDTSTGDGALEGSTGDDGSKLRALAEAHASELAAYESRLSEDARRASEVVESLRAEIALAEQRLADAEVRATEAASRAETAEQEVAELRDALAAMERESQGRLAALELDLTSARLRADAASRELSDFSAELRSLRDTSETYVASTQSTMQDLQARLDTATSALNGRSAKAPGSGQGLGQSFVGQTSGPASPSVETAPPASLYELVSLPGMSDDLSAQLRDIGVQSVTDIAGWTPDDVERFQAWLPDHPGVIARNSWVEVARSLVAQAEANPEKGGGADEESNGSGVFYDARAHSEIVG